MSKPIVVIDAGHGDFDSGAVGVNGAKEKDKVLETALALSHILRDDDLVTPKLTRSTDVFLSLSRRAEFANEVMAALFISIHNNGYPEGRARGFESFSTPGYTYADEFNQILYRRWEAAYPDQPIRWGETKGADKEANFAVLRHTKAPAVLIEIGFITNPQDLTIIERHDYNAEIIAGSIYDYFGLSTSDLPQLPDVDPPSQTPITDQFVERQQILDDLQRLQEDIESLIAKYNPTTTTTQ